MATSSSGTFGLTDAPVSNIGQESLGVLDYVESLSEFIRNCETPLTISFQGDWGTGKTSLMNMVRERLSQPGKLIETRWFNTWQFAQFQTQDETPLRLLSSFLEELGDDKASHILGQVGKLFSKAAGHVAKAAVDISTGGAGDLVKEGLERMIVQDNAGILRRLREDITKAVESLLTKKGANRLVIFIDDIDRLVPERAVEILELIKLFLDVPNCVFVLAVDYHVVSKGLEKKFGVSMNDLKGKSFFDKIIQLPFNLPVAQYDITHYMESLFSSSRFNVRKEDMGLLVGLAANSLGANPRSLKRLFNTLQLLNIVAGKKGMLERSEIASAEERQRLLFAVLCLQLAYEPVYQLLLKDREQLGTEYFGVLSDPLQLKDRPELNETVKQALAGRGDLNDAIARFGDFMESFTQAAQLASDKAEDADQVLSQNEIDLLRGFLSLSALTSAAGGQMEAIPGTFRHKVRMLELIERELKPKYQASLAKMNSVFKTEFCGDKQGKGEGWIGFDYRLGAFSFDVWMGWKDDSQDLRASLFQASNVTNAHLAAVKNMICAWCEAQKKAFPAIQFHHLKNREFAYIEMIPFQGGDAPEAEQQRFADFSGIM